MLDPADQKKILDTVYSALTPEEMERLTAAGAALDRHSSAIADIWGYVTNRLIGAGATVEELHEAIDAFAPLWRR